jgi:DNA-binding CsgD family transcriptional regulator
MLELAEQVQRLDIHGHRDVELRLLIERQSVADYLDTATALVCHEVLSMHAGLTLSAHALQEGRERGRLLCDRGVRLRTIFPRRLAPGGYLVRHFDSLASAGYHIRVADALPARVITFDRCRAVVAIDPVDPNAGAIALEGEPFVQSLVAMFEHYWLHATEARFSRDDPALTLSPREQAVMRLLATGIKDETIARRLGMSVRTISRIVSDLMRRLGASSRFEAGVRAAGLGWTD